MMEVVIKFMENYVALAACGISFIPGLTKPMASTCWFC